MEPRFNEVAGDRRNSLVKSRVRYIEVLFICFTITEAKNTVCHIEVFVKSRFHCTIFYNILHVSVFAFKL